MLKVKKGATRYWEDGSIQMHDTARVQSQPKKATQARVQGKGAMKSSSVGQVRASLAKKPKAPTLQKSRMLPKLPTPSFRKKALKAYK